MRKTIAVAAALGVFSITIPALARDSSRVDDTDFARSHGGHAARVDCVGTVVWDTGMYDAFTPPTGCSSAASSACFVNARNDQGIESDWRQLAAQFIGTGGDPLTNVKIWGRFNQYGYDWLATTPGAFHGFCLRIYEDPSQGSICPDGTNTNALGNPAYDVYIDASHFVAAEVPTGIARCFSYCITLPTPFQTIQDHFYWVAISGDFDNTQYEGGWTQWFWRMAPTRSAILCEPVANYNATAGDHQGWESAWRGLNVPCWEGWDLSLVLYTNPVQSQTGACCLGGSDCSIHSPAECQSIGGQYMGDGSLCDSNPCATPTRPSTWGKLKQGYRGASPTK